MINQFRGDYYFLSNFYSAPVEYEGMLYENNEAAFQAAKVLEGREKFQKLPPNKAKSLGRRVKLRPDWEEIKEDVMYQVCLDKFTRNPDLREKLIATGDEHLEEGNTWGDRTWGTCNGTGENKLGKILMRIRDELK